MRNTKSEKNHTRTRQQTVDRALGNPGYAAPEQLAGQAVDVSQIDVSELSCIRGIVPARLNTFSNANRTRNPEVVEKFFRYASSPRHPEKKNARCASLLIR